MVFTPVKRGIVPYKLFAAFTATGKVFHGRVKPHMVASSYKNKSRAHNVRPAENHPFTVILHFQFSIISISTRGLPAYPHRTR